MCFRTSETYSSKNFRKILEAIQAEQMENKTKNEEKTNTLSNANLAKTNIGLEHFSKRFLTNH